MKLLLDENLPHRLRPLLTGHDSATVAYMRWGGVKNGQLLQLAADAGFDAMLTMDANIRYQQSLASLPLAVVVIRAVSNDLEDLRPLVPALLTALANLPARQVTIVV